MSIRDLDFIGLWRNPIFLSGFVSLVLAQFIKTVIATVRSRKMGPKKAFWYFIAKTGGMPSSHCATAVSICVAIALKEGFSDLFILSLFVMLITIRDSLGVRRAAGLQAQALNRLGNELARQGVTVYEPVKEVHGHTLPEVIVGSFLGLGIAFFFWLV
jgi:acid phosphatase family membrane protein YuiD